MRPENGPDHLRPTLPFEDKWSEGGPADFVRETDRSEGGPNECPDWAVGAALVERPTDRLRFGPLSRTVRLWRDGCGQTVLRGLDADRCALAVTVDPYPLNPAGEVGALMAGRTTYLLTRGQLDPRDRWNIPGHLPSHKRIVLAAHDCTGIPDAWRLPHRPASRPAAVTEESF